MASIESSYNRLESWFYDHHQGHYPLGETPTFEEWVNGMSISEFMGYLVLGEELAWSEQ